MIRKRNEDGGGREAKSDVRQILNNNVKRNKDGGGREAKSDLMAILNKECNEKRALVEEGRPKW